MKHLLSGRKVRLISVRRNPTQIEIEHEDDGSRETVSAPVLIQEEKEGEVRRAVASLEGREESPPAPPYPWCPQPDICTPLGRCPRNPNCGD